MPKYMKLTDVGSDDATVEEYITNNDWVMQQKFDGTRIIVNWDIGTDEMVFCNDGVKPVTHAAAKLKLPDLESELRLILHQARTEGLIAGEHFSFDGELLIRTGEYLIWDALDMISQMEGDVDERPWWKRRVQLSEIFKASNLADGLTKLTPTAEGPTAKRAMWQQVNELGVEGAVSKHKQSFWIPGARTKDWVKHKLCVDSDLVVLTAQREFKPDSTVVKMGSASLGAYENGELKAVCSASLIGKDLTIEPGDVVTVRYLYREPGGGLVQPRIMHKREDKSPEECDFEQFAPYSREVVGIK